MLPGFSSGNEKVARIVEAFGSRSDVVQRLTGVVVNAPRPAADAPAAPVAKPMGPVLVQGGRK